MGKRGTGRSHTGVESRGNSIRIRFDYRGRRSETLKLEPTTPNLKYAAGLRAEIVRKIALGTFRYTEYFPNSPLAAGESGPAPKTFSDLAKTWLASAEIEKSTREGYRKILDRYWLPAVGDQPINAISKSRLLDVLSTVIRSKKTRNNVLIPARRVFALAFDDELIERDPAARIEYAKHQGPGPDPFEPDEVDAILGKIEKLYGEEVENYFGVGFFSGPRTSEHIAVRWEDLDLRTAVWRVRRAKVLREEKGTKTDVERDHELSSHAAHYFKRQREKTGLKSVHVFLDPVTGKQFNDDKPPRERYWRPTLKLLGIRYREPKQMRHTYITMAIMAGANPVWVARQSGNSPRVIFKHYARWIERADRGREAAKVEAALGQIWGKTSRETGGT
jgi:integrase